ncbi:PREDICTED: ubiquitin-like-specific protease 1D [Populus euphratica]|uniref:Ubiquitin-like-specific protease 1D n=1 Tax=Populus euphratica TaxID=75702 RepID=A0AAJ6TBY4_POPEU|nr:PREDICTED: ubiquitin-like-specific protease 1D [Populus euphratica]
MGEEKSKKTPLDLDSNWDVIMGRDDGEPPPLVIVKNTPQLQPQPTLSQREDFASISDKKLEEQIERNKIHVVKLGRTLPDKGEKLQFTIKAMEEELDQRKHRRPAQMDVAECAKHRNSTASNGFGHKDASSQVKNSKSQFSTIFSRKMEENTDCRVGNAFDKELTTLGHCNRQNMRSNGRSWKKRKQNIQSSSRQLPFQCATSVFLNGERRGPANGDQKGKASSAHLLHHNSENFSTNSSKKKDDCRVLPSNGSRPRKDPTVVVLDEDEPQLGTTELAKELAEHMKDAKISYPSRDDPASVEIAYKDMDCLAPEAFLTSPIMNFYIRYIRLQASPANKATCDYHFFNTFFYKKLEQAISYKGSDKESFFVKFRRWWKGVNIFEKAYILIPIHDDLHWSLVIICFPDKKDESGPIILHLDSLGFHRSSTVFSNIKSYLKEEWRYMNQEVVPTDFPIPDRIWKHLDRRIEDKIIAVPQQKNDYDCGLFVLFFMERFIQEAPERLKKRDLAMFGKKWFRPEEASDLRKKIRTILMDEFQNAFKSGHISESSSSSGGDPP